MMADTVRDKMFEARDLIQAKRYSEARSLLVTIDHPKAYEWLQKLDDVEARERSMRTQAVHNHQAVAETLETRNPYAHQPVYDPIYDTAVNSYDRGALVQSQPEPKRTNVLHVIGALLGGVVGAVIGGAIWAAVAYFTEYEIGYIAILVGALTGILAVLFSGGRRGIPIQFIAVLTALLGIVVGKYAAVYLVGMKSIYAEAGREMSLTILQDVSPIQPQIIQGIFEDIVAALAPLDALFVVLAVFAAIRIAASTRESRQPRLQTT